jgi:hypothetical protein
MQIVEVRFIGADNSNLRFFEVISNDKKLTRDLPDIINEEQMETQFMNYVFRIHWSTD